MSARVRAVVPHAAAAIAAMLLAGAAAAFSEAAVPDVTFPAERVAAFAKQVEREAARRGALVFIVARVGRPPSEVPRGIRFTHTAFAAYSRIARADGSTGNGYVVHNLYQRDGAPGESELTTDFLFDYFAGATVLRAGMIIPSRRLQRRLLDMIGSEAYRGLHNPAYSAIANPFDPRYQNCTEFVLDVLTASIYATTNRAEIKANLAAYFKPQPVEVGTFRLLLGSLFMPDVRTRDHAGPIRTATFTTIADHLERYGLAEARLEVSEDTAAIARAP